MQPVVSGPLFPPKQGFTHFIFKQNTAQLYKPQFVTQHSIYEERSEENSPFQQ